MELAKESEQISAKIYLQILKKKQNLWTNFQNIEEIDFWKFGKQKILQNMEIWKMPK